MNPAQRNRSAALLKSTGYEDGPALTLQSTDGDIPHGRELSFAWLAGTVMTGLTSVLLMGAALYVSFQGQDTFSTAYEALQIVTRQPVTATDLSTKTNRVRPVAQTRSEREIVEASIKETIDGRDIQVVRVNEEHGYVRGKDVDTLRVGDRIKLMPAHICPVINLTDYVMITEGDQVVDRWRVDARGRVD